MASIAALSCEKKDVMEVHGFRDVDTELETFWRVLVTDPCNEVGFSHGLRETASRRGNRNCMTCGFILQNALSTQSNPGLMRITDLIAYRAARARPIPRPDQGSNPCAGNKNARGVFAPRVLNCGWAVRGSPDGRGRPPSASAPAAPRVLRWETHPRFLSSAP